MREYDLKRLISDQKLLNEKIKEFSNQQILRTQEIDKEEIQGHILKSEHNLRFVQENIKLGFYDWVITGCYYTCYHAALALIMTKGFSSKNHYATLCVLIKEFYNNKLTKEDIEIISELLDYQDVLFYVETKNKREDATYSSKLKFNKEDIEDLRLKTIMFVSKAKHILSLAGD